MIRILLLVALAGCASLAGTGEPLPGLPADLEIGYGRGACYGFCPVYDVTFFADGTQRYHGEEHVLVRGDRARDVDPDGLRDVVAAFDGSGFRELRDRYTRVEDGCTSILTDGSDAWISLRSDGAEKSVVGWHGCTGAPEVLGELEDRIVALADVGRWVGR